VEERRDHVRSWSGPGAGPAVDLPRRATTLGARPRGSARILLLPLTTVVVLAAVLGLTDPGSPASATGAAWRPVAAAFGSQLPPAPGVGCVLTDLGGCVTGAVDAFLQGLVSDALNPLLAMLSDTLLTTPSPDQLPGLREFWNQS
jgi:hypothetical protein